SEVQLDNREPQFVESRFGVNGDPILPETLLDHRAITREDVVVGIARRWLKLVRAFRESAVFREALLVDRQELFVCQPAWSLGEIDRLRHPSRVLLRALVV